MAVLIDPKKKHEYVLEQDKSKDKKFQSVFFLKPMSGREFAQVATQIQKATDQPEVVYDVLKLTLTNWENLQLSNGEKLTFSTDNIDLLPIEIAGELMGECLKMAGLDGEDAKN